MSEYDGVRFATRTTARSGRLAKGKRASAPDEPPLVPDENANKKKKVAKEDDSRAAGTLAVTLGVDKCFQDSRRGGRGIMAALKRDMSRPTMAPSKAELDKFNREADLRDPMTDVRKRSIERYFTSQKIHSVFGYN